MFDMIPLAGNFVPERISLCSGFFFRLLFNLGRQAFFISSVILHLI